MGGDTNHSHMSSSFTDFSDCVRFHGAVEGGFCWDALTKNRIRNRKALEPYGYKVFSQNDEDGIIHEIFDRIGTTNKVFIEFGVQDGLESNSHLLLHYGWSGLWIEGSEVYCDEIAIKFKPVIENGQLRVCNAFITKDNINELFIKNGLSGEIDLLSIDIDGNDYYIWDAIKEVNSRVIVVEYNAKFPPDLEWCQAYDASHVWMGSDWHGASLKALEKLGRNKGYRLVGTNLRGCNAFFVRNDLIKDLFYKPETAEALYNPLRLNLTFLANHAAQYCLAVQKDNLGIFNYQNYRLVSGFHTEEKNGAQRYAWTSEETAVLELLVHKGTEKINIPVSVPTKVLNAFENYSVRIHSENGFDQEFPVKECNRSFEISLKPVLNDDSRITLHIYTPCLWSPADLLDSPDTRKLGIDIILSDITQE